MFKVMVTLKYVYYILTPEKGSAVTVTVHITCIDIRCKDY